MKNGEKIVPRMNNLFFLQNEAHHCSEAVASALVDPIPALNSGIRIGQMS
jgi:hypothetical protein